MSSAYFDPYIGLMLAKERQQSLLAEVEHDRLADKVKSARAAFRPARHAQFHRTLQVALAMMLSVLRRGFSFS